MKKFKEYFTKKEFIFVVVALIITLSALSYAFFVRIDETGSNIARTECFKLTLQGNNDINLQDAYPMSEQEGAALTPYTFTVRNICNTTADYQVNIETLNTSSLDTEYVRVKLDNNASMILKRNELNTTNVNQNVKEGRKIATGTLRSNEEITYNLRLWIDEASTKEQSANKTYTAKVSVMAAPNTEVHDITIAYIYDGTTNNQPPSKNDGYVLTNITCTNATGEWDDVNWTIKISNLTDIVTCNLTFDDTTNYQIIEYNPNGGYLADQYIKGTIGQQIGTLATPTKTGFTFDGWYKESSLTTQVQSTTVIDSSLTNLYAKYTESTATPSDSNPPLLSANNYYRATANGYLYSTQQNAGYNLVYIGTGKSFDISSILPDVYQDLTADNFYIRNAGTASASGTSLGWADGQRSTMSNKVTQTKTYDATTGALTFYTNAVGTLQVTGGRSYSSGAPSADAEVYCIY